MRPAAHREMHRAVFLILAFDSFLVKRSDLKTVSLEREEVIPTRASV
jgi:hypothetical protein